MNETCGFPSAPEVGPLRKVRMQRPLHTDGVGEMAAFLVVGYGRSDFRVVIRFG